VTRARRVAAADGQAGILLLGILLAIVVGAFVLAAVARGVLVQSDLQRAADLGALAGAKAMHEAFPRLFQPVGGLSAAEYTAIGRRTAEEVARRNGAERVEITIPAADDLAPTRIAVRASATVAVGERRTPASFTAEAELAPAAAPGVARSGDEYAGPLAYRDGKPMRPDVAQAYDRLAAAAQQDGVALVVTSGFRSNAEQAKLFAANPDPTWVARPGTSLHRLGTELDLGPASAYGWLAANAKRFGFIQRYSWEPWHYGFTASAGTRSLGYGPSKSSGAGAVPSYVPAQYRDAIRRAAQRWSVGAAVLAAQLYAESGFRPDARSSAGALGIAQFMPGTARAYDIDPLDPEQAIDGQAHYLHDLLRQVGSVPLALAAYNAGPGPVRACGCTTPYPETAAYVAKILALLDGKFDPVAPGGGLTVRLVR